MIPRLLMRDLPDVSDGSENKLYEQYRFVADPGQTLLRIDKFLVCRITKVCPVTAFRMQPMPVL